MNAVFDFFARLILEMWGLCVAMAPWLLAGFLAAGILGQVIPGAFVRRHLSRRGWGSVFKAVLIGCPLPVCSCGVIPLAAELRKAGASKGATAAFIATTPQTGVDSIAATYALMGLPFTFARVATDLLAGFLAGGLINAFGEADAAAEVPAADECPKCRAARLAREKAARGTWARRARAAFAEAFFGLPRDIGGAIILGVFLGALISVCFPQDALGGYVSARWAQYLVVTLIAVPMYVCSTGAIPIAFGLVAAGFSPGAAIVFLSLGPATNAALLAVLWKTLGRRETVLYVAALAAAAWAMGGVCDAFALAAPPAGAGACHGQNLPAWKLFAGGALAALLAVGYLRKRARAEKGGCCAA